MQSQNPIFDIVVAEFAERNIHYINLLSGIRPFIPELDEESYVKPDAKPLGWNYPTEVLDPIRAVHPNTTHKVVSVDDEPVTVVSKTEKSTSLDDSG